MGKTQMWKHQKAEESKEEHSYLLLIAQRRARPPSSRTGKCVRLIGHRQKWDMLYFILIQNNVQLSTGILLLLGKITDGFYEMRGIFLTEERVQWREIWLLRTAGRRATPSSQRPQISVEDALSLQKIKVALTLQKGTKSITYISSINISRQCHLFLHSLFQSWVNEIYPETLFCTKRNKAFLQLGQVLL